MTVDATYFSHLQRYVRDFAIDDNQMAAIMPMVGGSSGRIMFQVV